MTALDTVARLLGTDPIWKQDRGVYWLSQQDRTVRDVATAMNSVGARFITITAYELMDDVGIRLEYHWDLEGRLLGFAFETHAGSIDSIFDLCEAADWIEQEVHEGFAIDFTGHAYEPLLLRDGSPTGVNLREEVR